ncbi:MAG: nitroreductase family deazaflavin-dependent oxidoreductase [Microthrixaceae bacterium]
MAPPASYSDRQVKVGAAVIKVMSRVTTWAYRLTDGRIGGRFMKGTDVILLTTIGRRSGEPRTVPLLFMEDGDDLIVVASQGGMPSNPAWYHNVTEHPEVTVNRRGVVTAMVATEVDEDERRELWPRLVEMYADFTDYAARTDRTIPVIRLRPA